MHIGPVGDGEAHPHQRYFLCSRDQLAVGVSYEHIHRTVLDLLMEEECVSLESFAVR